MHSALLIWTLTGLAAAVLLGVGGYHYEMATKATPPPEPMMATESTGDQPQVTPASAKADPICVELARPQSDDQRHYVPVPRQEDTSVMGYVAAARPVKQVLVNDVPAATYAADYVPYGTPAGYSTLGFNAPLVLAPDTPLDVVVTDADGYQQTILYEPNRVDAYNRVHQLYVAAPSDPYACLRLANTFAVLGDYNDCFPLYHRCIGLDAGLYVGSFFLGLSLFDCDRYDDAWAEFHRCTLVAPGFYPAFYGLGECYHARGYDDYALAQYGWVARRDPGFVEANWRMGDIYAGRNDWPHAAAQYRQVVAHNSRFAAAHFGLGEALAHQGKWTAAANEIRAGAGLNPKDPRASHYLTATLAHQTPTHIASARGGGFAGRQYARAAGVAALGAGAAAVAGHGFRAGQGQTAQSLVQHGNAGSSGHGQVQTAHPQITGGSHARAVGHGNGGGGGTSHPQATHTRSSGGGGRAVSHNYGGGHATVTHRSSGGGTSHPQATHTRSSGGGGHATVTHRSSGGGRVHASYGGGGFRGGGGGHPQARSAPSHGGGHGGGRAPGGGRRR